MKFRLTEEIWKEGNMYVSYCPELDISSCGEDVQQAKDNLYETIHIAGYPLNASCRNLGLL